MNQIMIDQLFSFAKKTLSQERLTHSIGVAETSQMLAKRFDIDSQIAYFAGLGHDIAREIPLDRQVELARQKALLEPHGQQFPVVLHGRLAAPMIKDHLGYDNALVTEAMANHTGCGGVMSDLDKILYIADSFEPNRSYVTSSNAEALKIKSLDDLFYLALKESITFLTQQQLPIYPETIYQYQLLKELYCEYTDNQLSS